MRKARFYQHLKTVNDNNGNPRRLFAVYGGNGDLMKVYEEGYRGKPEELRGLCDLPEINIPIKEYNEIKRNAKDQEIYNCD